MPIQFTCSHCRRTLSVTRRKAGTAVTCPKCGQVTDVPQSPGTVTEVHPVLPVLDESKTIAEAPVPTGTDVATATGSDPAISWVAEIAAATASPPASDIPAFDDIPALIGDAETVPTAERSARPVMPAAPPPLSSPATASAATPPFSPTEAVGDFQLTESTAPAVARLAQARRGRSGGNVLLVTRQAVYAQAALMAGLLVVAFLAGLLVGRGHRADTSEKVAGKPVELGGRVLYALSPGDSLPDEGAVVIALPADKKPDVKLAADGLRVDDEADSEDEAALKEAGAAVARSDASGEFQLVVPRPGNYSLLMISSHAKRPGDVTLPTADGKELGKYFASPAELIGQQRYALISRRLAGSPGDLTHKFGPTDKR